MDIMEKALNEYLMFLNKNKNGKLYFAKIRISPKSLLASHRPVFYHKNDVSSNSVKLIYLENNCLPESLYLPIY